MIGVFEEMAVSMAETGNIQDMPRAPYNARKSGSVQNGKEKKNFAWESKICPLSAGAE